MEKICNVSFGEKNWSQASLPIRHTGLGLRPAADLSLPCFLSSSHACKGLVNRLLPSLNLEIPYGYVNDAIDDWSKHHDSSPLEKGTQAAWDDLACRDTLKSLLNTHNPCLGTTVGYLLHKRVTLRLPQDATVAKLLKAQDAAMAKLLMSWGSMASPVLKMQAASQGTQPSTASSRGHWPALVSPLPWSL